MAGRSSEILAIPLLLERLALAGALVTIDAIGTQSTIAEKILERGGDHLLALKANRPATFKDIQEFFAAPPGGSVERFDTSDGDHGRIENRRHCVCPHTDWLFSDRRYPHEVAFPGLAVVAMVEAETERGGKTSRERRYDLSSAKLDAKTFAKAGRAHWGVENKLHWVLDVRGVLGRLTGRLTAPRRSRSIAAMADARRPNPARRIEHAAREERLARALRANLRRRKEQARAREPHAGEPEDNSPADSEPVA